MLWTGSSMLDSCPLSRNTQSSLFNKSFNSLNSQNWNMEIIIPTHLTGCCNGKDYWHNASKFVLGSAFYKPKPIPKFTYDISWHLSSKEFRTACMVLPTIITLSSQQPCEVDSIMREWVSHGHLENIMITYTDLNPGLPKHATDT